MFQFRRLPAYTYLIQCTLHGYCPCGLPHSEISGSMDICSSPKLIAACHVLRRLLMPRHSPCALYSLTTSSQSPLVSVSAFGENFNRSLAPPFPSKSRFWWRENRKHRFLCSNLSEKFWFSWIMQASQIFEIVIVTLHPFGCCSTIKFTLSVSFQTQKPLCCLTSLFITLFSFQGANRFQDICPVN